MNGGQPIKVMLRKNVSSTRERRGGGGERKKGREASAAEGERHEGDRGLGGKGGGGGEEREKNGEKAWNGEPSVSESKEARPGRKQSEYANGIISALSEKRAARAFCMQPRRRAAKR